jgi:hypothetical protein
MHVERQQVLASNGANGTKIADTYMAKRPEQGIPQSIPSTLRKRERSRLCVSSCARAHRQVNRPTQHQFGHTRRAVEVIAAIGIHEKHDLEALGCPHTSEAGRTVAAAWLSDHYGASAFGDATGSICAAVVNDDHTAQAEPAQARMLEKACHQCAHGFRFVQRWQDGGNPWFS